VAGQSVDVIVVTAAGLASDDGNNNNNNNNNNGGDGVDGGVTPRILFAGALPASCMVRLAAN
jgi:hypothetical protein